MDPGYFLLKTEARESFVQDLGDVLVAPPVGLMTDYFVSNRRKGESKKRKEGKGRQGKAPRVTNLPPILSTTISGTRYSSQFPGYSSWNRPVVRLSDWINPPPRGRLWSKYSPPSTSI